MLQCRSETIPSFNKGLSVDRRAALIAYRQPPGHKVHLRAGRSKQTSVIGPLTRDPFGAPLLCPTRVYAGALSAGRQ
jgi:hypothetical protein